MAERILMVGTYPIEHAIGGGQMRARALRDAYIAAGHQALYIGVFYKGFYSRWSKLDIPVGAAGEAQIQASPWTGDLICAQQLRDDPAMRRRFVQVLQHFRPDVVQIEQAFPYLAVRPILDELGMRPRIVFSSHNVEHTMKREILEAEGWSAERLDATVRIISNVEHQLARDCDLLIAVSQADAEAHRAMGAKNVVEARNGIWRSRSTAAAERRWRLRLRQRGAARLMLYVGSAHPPNWRGFLAMVGTRLGFLPPDTRIVLVGGIGEYLHQHFNRRSIDESTMWRRMVPLGRVEQADLAALLALTDLIMLPMTEGGGSNLKTAEAILSGRTVVATRYAFRSFESLMGLPNIHLADTPGSFRSTLLAALDAPRVPRSAEQQRDAESVLWDHCLQGALQAVSRL